MQGYLIDRPMRTRDALEPLLAGLGMTASERDGRLSISGEEPVGAVLTREGLALPDDGESRRSDRSLELLPAACRVRTNRERSSRSASV